MNIQNQKLKIKESGNLWVKCKDRVTGEEGYISLHDIADEINRLVLKAIDETIKEIKKGKK